MGHRSLRRLRVALASSLLVAGLGVAAAAPVHAETVWFAFMTGDQEVPGPGDPDGDGIARITLDPGNGDPLSGEVCVRWDVLGIEPATAAHIHLGAEGVSGGVVVPLPPPDADGLGEDCTFELDPAVVQAIIDDPTAYYVNVHNDEFQDGAIRGQLDAFDVTNVTVSKQVCPEGIDTPAEIEADPSACTPAALTGTVGDPPPGTVFDPPILEFDMEVTIEDAFGVLSIEDADLDGGFTCNETTCSGSRTYRWIDIFIGETIVTQETFPEGYEFGWATIESVDDGGDAPEGMVDGSSILFDTTGFEDGNGFLVRFYDVLADTAAPTTPPPAPTIPPTTTAREPASGSVGWLGGLLGVLGVGLLGGGLAWRRRSRT